MSDKSTTAFTFEGLLTVLFIALKLTRVIDWSWWWVLSPLWMPIALFILFFGIGLLILKATK